MMVRVLVKLCSMYSMMAEGFAGMLSHLLCFKVLQTSDRCGDGTFFDASCQKKAWLAAFTVLAGF